MLIMLIMLIMILNASVVFAGQPDVDPSVIIGSCKDEWCRPIVDAYDVCKAAGRPNCAQDEQVKKVHLRALGQKTPEEVEEEKAASARTREAMLMNSTKFLWYRIGMTFEDLRTTALENCSNKSVQYCKSNVEIGGAKREIMVKIAEDKLALVMFDLHGNDDFIAVAKMLTDRYGKPSKTEAGIVQNNFGAQFERTRLSWLTNDAYITATNILNRVGEGAVSFQDRAQLEARFKASKSSPNPF